MSQSHTTERVAELDGLRGIAIALVLVWHYIYCAADGAAEGVAGKLAMAAISWSFAGVDLFFVLSGYLIGSILIRNRSAENYFQAFYVRRFARLAPAYLAMLALFPIVTPLLLASGGEAGRWLVDGGCGSLPFWSYPLYVQNIFMGQANCWGGQWLAVTWSLAVEEQFYILAPLLVYWLKPRLLPWVLGAAVVSALAGRIAMGAIGASAISTYVLLPLRWDGLALGMLIAWALADERLRAAILSDRKALNRYAAILLAGAAAFIAIGVESFSTPMLTFGHTYLAVLAGALLLAALHGDGTRLKAFLCWRPLRWLGLVSYGVYLLHQPVNGVVRALAGRGIPRLADAGDVLLAIVSLLLVLGIARLSWRYFEKPLIDLGHQVSYGAGRRVAPA